MTWGIWEGNLQQILLGWLGLNVQGVILSNVDYDLVSSEIKSGLCVDFLQIASFFPGTPQPISGRISARYLSHAEQHIKCD